ncbi:hypothetical protein H4Q26_008520 [Puccinia striiformis f. sp. tritici PST-130]|nr:hypothetical protein H4Q26_008520 [Puccinia striiformis f. sp. tritici PST-130]
MGCVFENIMVDSRENGMSGLIVSFSTLGNEDSPEQIKLYEVLVSGELTRVHNQYHSLSGGINNKPDPLVLFNQVDIRKELLDKLKSKRLPTLRRQVISLSNALSDRQAKPLSKLKLVLKTLSKLDITMGKIKFATACIYPEIEPGEVRHDKDFKELKQVLCSRVAVGTLVVNGYVCKLLGSSCRFIGESGHDFADSVPEKRTELIRMRDICSKWIDKARELMEGSELTLIRVVLKNTTDQIDESLEKFLEFMHSRPWSPPLSVEQDTSSGRQITISVTAILRLSRLLYAKLFRLSTDQENWSMVTDLSSREIDLYTKRIGTLSGSIERFVNAMCGSFADPLDGEKILEKELSNILSAPQDILTMTEHIFVSVVHQEADQPSSKINYKALFYQWNSAHQSITRTFYKALRFTTSYQLTTYSNTPEIFKKSNLELYDYQILTASR